MARHTPVIIDGTTLLGRLADYENCDDGCTPDGAKIDARGWYVVTWPQHVLSPKYNSDADYHPFDSLADAQEYAPNADRHI